MGRCSTVVVDCSRGAPPMTLLARDPETGGRPLDEPAKPRPRTVSTVLRPELVLLSVASLGAALLHAAFAPVHFTETWTHGLFFAVLAWLQLALAVALIAAPSRRVFRFGVLNVFVIAVWVMSRRVGSPFGPNAWVAEPV